MCNPIVYLYYCYCICIKLCGISIILCMYFHMTHVTSGSFFPHISCQKRVFRRYIYIFENVRNYVKCAFKFMHLIWSVWISVYIILHLMPVILFVVVTEGYFVIHLLLWRTKICTGYIVTLRLSSSSMGFSNILSYSLMLIEWSIAMEYYWSFSRFIYSKPNIQSS